MGLLGIYIDADTEPSLIDGVLYLHHKVRITQDISEGMYKFELTT